MVAKDIVEKLLSFADIHIDGHRPWDIQVHDDRLYDRVLSKQSLGLGEAYMESWWDCESLDVLFTKLLEAKLDQKIKTHPQIAFQIFLHRLINHQTRDRAKKSIQHHYDLGNRLFHAMLDPSMNYSCAFWEQATTLEEAQRDKMELICKKLQLAPGMRLLDIGCGWGGLAKYAAQNYGVDVLGITLSIEQKKWMEEQCQNLPVKVQLLDYRDLQGSFDRIVSVGMFEHVGYKNYTKLMHAAFKNLKEEGLFLLHTIGTNATKKAGDPWINKYIFPQGMLPSISQIGQALEPYFVMEDWHNFGAYYDHTLMAWYQNFNTHWEHLKTHYDETFRRMWNYYLLSCAGLFRARQIQLWQIVLSKNGVKGGYRCRYTKEACLATS